MCSNMLDRSRRSSLPEYLQQDMLRLDAYDKLDTSNAQQMQVRESRSRWLVLQAWLQKGCSLDMLRNQHVLTMRMMLIN